MTGDLPLGRLLWGYVNLDLKMYFIPATEFGANFIYEPVKNWRFYPHQRLARWTQAETIQEIIPVRFRRTLP